MTLDPESGAPVVAPVPPARLGGFEIIGVLGQGGFGRVYLARDPLLDRHVALKVLRADRLGDATHLQRFRREAAALSRLSHPSVVAVHAFGTAPETGEPYLVMEYAGGVPLSDLLLRDAGGRLSGEADASFGAADVVDLVSQLTQGLDADLAVRVVIRSPTHGEARSELAAARWGLTQRQAEVLVWVAQGLTNRSIATIFEISEAVVELHVSNLLQRAGVENRASLVASFWQLK